jgi:RimJ/RimL family protein N-acetyltransferase
MQKSWREDGDKLTFIVCLPLSLPSSSSSEKSRVIVPEETDAPERMLGDVNLFLRFDNEDEDSVVGELELMIAEKQKQGKGFGRPALLAFLRYILSSQDGIVDEFLRAENKQISKKEISYFSVKIGKTNIRSITLFESLGFTKVTPEPNYFGEFELRRADLNATNLEQMLDRFEVTGYQELGFSTE